MNQEYFQPIFLQGDRNTGVLLIHGFTGTPKSVAPWAYGFHEAGHTVSVPLLSGHGSDWRELRKSDWGDWLASAEAALTDLEKSVDHIFVVGFSMGGAIATRLAELYPNRVSGLILLNPTIYDNHIRMVLSKILAPIIQSVKSEGTDVALPGAPITSQQRVSLQAANSLHAFRHIVRRDLSLVRTPLKVFLSKNDHVVPPSNGLLIANSVSSKKIEIEYFERSFHVVPLDYEAEQLIVSSNEFIENLLPALI